MYFSVVSSPAQADLSPVKSNKTQTNFINICNFIDHLLIPCIQNYLSVHDHFCCECRLSFVTTAQKTAGKSANITTSQMHPVPETRRAAVSAGGGYGGSAGARRVICKVVIRMVVCIQPQETCSTGVDKLRGKQPIESLCIPYIITGRWKDK
ncbi:MAG: hypothetical protein LRY66_17700 [Saccharospirillaceae bacterium]|nr:hypothetical protein [Saccharospirillaceae bacterium]